jgi:hypothetical protein
VLVNFVAQNKQDEHRDLYGSAFYLVRPIIREIESWSGLTPMYDTMKPTLSKGSSKKEFIPLKKSSMRHAVIP